MTLTLTTTLTLTLTPTLPQAPGTAPRPGQPKLDSATRASLMSALGHAAKARPGISNPGPRALAPTLALTTTLALAPTLA